mgnify:CR=1 FL=1
MTPSGQPINSFILMANEQTFRCPCSRIWVQGQHGLEDIQDEDGYYRCGCGRLFKWST